MILSSLMFPSLSLSPSLTSIKYIKNKNICWSTGTRTRWEDGGGRSEGCALLRGEGAVQTQAAHTATRSPE